jgi:hypothetical protein
MRALAEFAMRGRREAVLLAMAGAMIPMFFWVGAAVIGLVTLRRGARDGLVVLLWASLPALVLAWLGQVLPLAALAVTALLAWMLRITASWPWTLCAAALLGLVLSAGLSIGGAGFLAENQKVLAALAEGMQRDAPELATALGIRALSATEVAGVFGVRQCLSWVICLLLARWWQAQLYNPGGLRLEMHALRLSGAQVTGLLIAAVLLYQLGPGFQLWIAMPLIPLLVAGIGLVHAMLAWRAASGWLAVFYVALLFVPALLHLVIVLAAMDGWLDLRQRLMPPRGGGDDNKV